MIGMCSRRRPHRSSIDARQSLTPFVSCLPARPIDAPRQRTGFRASAILCQNILGPRHSYAGCVAGVVAAAASTLNNNPTTTRTNDGARQQQAAGEERDMWNVPPAPPGRVSKTDGRPALAHFVRRCHVVRSRSQLISIGVNQSGSRFEWQPSVGRVRTSSCRWMLVRRGCRASRRTRAGGGCVANVRLDPSRFMCTYKQLLHVSFLLIFSFAFALFSRY